MKTPYSMYRLKCTVPVLCLTMKYVLNMVEFNKLLNT